MKINPKTSMYVTEMRFASKFQTVFLHHVLNHKPTLVMSFSRIMPIIYFMKQT